jgi:hypothetical protein
MDWVEVEERIIENIEKCKARIKFWNTARAELDGTADDLLPCRDMDFERVETISREMSNHEIMWQCELDKLILEHMVIQKKAMAQRKSELAYAEAEFRRSQ